MSEIKEIIKRLVEFRDEREWGQFHNSKDLAVAISIEASELLELFLWKQNEEVGIDELKSELADILSYCFLLANKHEIDIIDIVSNKIQLNESRYPLSKSRGNSKKHSEL